ncbi:MAG: right-handed parallel beta-helix repeat-containing protein [Phycisphaerae bacterium]
MFALCMLVIPAVFDSVRIDHDNVEIRESCVIQIACEPIADADGNGVIQIIGDGITVDFQGQTLRGATPNTPGDQLSGVGIRVAGKNVTLRNASVAGYKVGIWASSADGLTIEDCDVSGNFRQHLKSTPKAEDAADWLWPHNNDADEWRKNYGAGIYVEDAANVTIRRSRARAGQNGLCLARVNESRIYDNDFSFLSGWGIALWRSSKNTLSRNAVDFCVRGYSHGVYNRGQDSAGFLVFEQCCENVFVENSGTHSGDGFFGFAGREALGEAKPPRDDFDYRRRGCNNNLLYRNDFSFAPAHGIEMTFSFGNRFIENRLEGNAICGVWGGYSQDTIIETNRFIENGEAGYRLERGGVNIEHGRGNEIAHNRFERNRCGVHLWGGDAGKLAQSPWGLANGVESVANLILDNTFVADEVAIHLRGPGKTWPLGNSFEGVKRELEAEADHQVDKSDGKLARLPYRADEPAIGDARPVGARDSLRGRDKIIITEWGPYDWQSPYLQRVAESGDAHEYRILGLKKPAESRAAADAGSTNRIDVSATGDVDVRRDESGEFPKLTVVPRRRGSVATYALTVRAGDSELMRPGVIVAAVWNVRFFRWSVDPRKDADAWRAEATNGVAVELPTLSLRYGNGGPSQLADAPLTLKAADLPRDRFGTLANTRLTLPAGKWTLTTTSDDGVRVWVDDRRVIDNWSWHGPTVDSAEIVADEAKTVEIRVEHFELDGYAILTLEIQPRPERDAGGAGVPPGGPDWAGLPDHP